MGPTLRPSVSLAVALAILWLLLSGHTELFLLALGVASVVFSVWVAKRLGIVDDEGHPIHVIDATVRYWPWLMKEIMVANIDVAKAILKGDAAVSPSVFTTKATQTDDLGRTIYANSITLTPGTITIDMDGENVTVHALTQGTRDGVLTGDMDRRVTALFDAPEDAA